MDSWIGPCGSTWSASRGGPMGRSSSSSTYPMPTPEAEGTSSNEGGTASKRILILHVAAGVGHARAAAAVESALRTLDPSCEPIVRDALEFSSPVLRRCYASTY